MLTAALVAASSPVHAETGTTFSRACTGTVDYNCTVPCKERSLCICPQSEPERTQCMNAPTDCSYYAPDVWHVPPNPKKSVCWDDYVPVGTLA